MQFDKLNGREGRYILEKSGFTLSDFARYVGKSSSWASALFFKRILPDRWAYAIIKLVGQESFERHFPAARERTHARELRRKAIVEKM
ncbi:MAG: hypothetical protein ACLFQX_00195 [Candidatus Kapaibacterium sp.]